VRPKLQAELLCPCGQQVRSCRLWPEGRELCGSVRTGRGLCPGLWPQRCALCCSRSLCSGLWSEGFQLCRSLRSGCVCPGLRTEGRELCRAVRSRCLCTKGFQLCRSLRSSRLWSEGCGLRRRLWPAVL